jgi:hypothetical protein
MTGRRGRKRASDTKGKSSARAAKPAPEATHLANKAGDPHANVSVFEPSHGPNNADRMDTVDEHATETLPATDPTNERAGVPVERRIDEGQNRGSE